MESGKETLNIEVFSVRNASLKNEKNSLASPTPIVEGERLRALRRRWDGGRVNGWKNPLEGRAVIRLDARQWRLTIERGAPFTPSPLIVGDDFYMVSDIGVASCLDVRTGEIHWQQRIFGNYSASPVFADNRIYFLSEEGVAAVIAPGKAFQRLAVNPLDGTTFASLAVSQRMLFIRSDTHLYRIGTRP